MGLSHSISNVENVRYPHLQTGARVKSYCETPASVHPENPLPSCHTKLNVLPQAYDVRFLQSRCFRKFPSKCLPILSITASLDVLHGEPVVGPSFEYLRNQRHVSYVGPVKFVNRSATIHYRIIPRFDQINIPI